MTIQTNTGPTSRRQIQPGNGRPVEPGTKCTVMTWAEIDDLLNTVRQANQIIEGVRMMADAEDLPNRYRSAFHTVTEEAIDRLNGVERSLTGYASDCAHQAPPLPARPYQAMSTYQLLQVVETLAAAVRIFDLQQLASIPMPTRDAMQAMTDWAGMRGEACSDEIWAVIEEFDSRKLSANDQGLLDAAIAMSSQYLPAGLFDITITRRAGK